MDKYVARQNIEHLRALVQKETDETKRKILLDILAKDEATLASIPGQAKKESKAGL